MPYLCKRQINRIFQWPCIACHDKPITYWKRRFRQKTAVSFIPVQMKHETQIGENTSSGLVLCKDGYRIEIQDGFKPEVLGEVLRTLRELQC